MSSVSRSSSGGVIVRTGDLLACCSVNVTEVYMGTRRGAYAVTSEIAQFGGRLYNNWRSKGRTAGLSDVTVAAVALTE